MPDYKNPLAEKKDKPKVKTYNFTAEQLQQYQDAAQSELLWPVVGCAGVAGMVAWRCR